MSLSVSMIDDPALVDAILTDPSIAPKLRHDAREPGFIDHPALSYHGAFVDGELVGVFAAIQATRWEVEVHAAILAHGLRHGRALGRLFLDAVFADPDVLRATGYVLGTLPSAANFCRRLGFVEEGRRRAACRVGGRVTDVIVMGLTREDAERTVPAGFREGRPC